MAEANTPGVKAARALSGCRQSPRTRLEETRVRRKVLPQAPAKASIPSRANSGVVTLKEGASWDLLTRRGAGDNRLLPASSESVPTPSAENQAAVVVFKAKLAGAFGCKTSETALVLLEQIMALEHPTTTMEPERTDTLLNAIALVAELQPATATEALLAVQMIGTHRAAMMFLANATKPEDSFDGRDRNVLRALRLMRLFTEQVEAMAKLKGKSGQQRVIVEHVNVAAGGQAIVGTVIPGGRGAGGEDRG